MDALNRLSEIAKKIDAGTPLTKKDQHDVLLLRSYILSLHVAGLDDYINEAISSVKLNPTLSDGFKMALYVIIFVMLPQQVYQKIRTD